MLTNKLLWQLIKAPSKTSSKILEADQQSTGTQQVLFDEDIADETYE